MNINFYSLCSHNYLDQLILHITGAKRRRFRGIVSSLLFSSLPQVVHIQFLIKPYELFILLVLCKLKKVPIVWTPHDIKPEHNLTSSYPLLSFFLNRMDAVIVLSQHDKKQFISFGVKEDRLKVIAHAGCQYYKRYQVGKRKARSLLNLPQDKIIFFQFGPILSYKGFDISAKAFFQLPKEVKEKSLLLFAGKILDKKLFSSFSNRINTKWCIKDRYLTNKEIGLLYSASDIVLYPYKEINQSGAIFDALAFGRPVIASSVGGIPEIITDKKEGLLTKPTAKALSKGILYMYNHPKQQKYFEKMSLVLGNKFSWKNAGEEHFALYKNLLRL